ncbi:MAG: amino acid permease [bacterium]
MSQDEKPGGSLGLAACTALVIGNMVGSGFFIAPAALAPYGTTAIIGWGVMAFGAVCLGLVFARLARIAPATGGPYAYTRMGFGRFAGFLIAWGYWISIWASLPAMAAALVGYLGKLIPGLGAHRALCVGIGLGSMWAVALLNMRGVKEAGIFQSLTTYTKLVPFLGISIFGLFWVDWGTFAVLNPSDQPFLSALAATAPLTMFAFLGIESATVPAGDVIDPERTIPRSTILGTLVAALIYILGTTVVMGVMPREVLMKSSAPFADAASAIWGHWAGVVIAVTAIISSLGALNGWTLMLGQVPMAAARDGAMPGVFAHVNARGVPAWGLVISVGLSTALVALEVSGSGAMVKFYNLIVQLSTDAAMIPYVFCSVVEAVLFVTRRPLSRALRIGPYTPVALVAFVFSLGTVYGSGATAGMWALILILLAAPIWVFLVGAKPGEEAET